MFPLFVNYLYGFPHVALGISYHFTGWRKISNDLDPRQYPTGSRKGGDVQYKQNKFFFRKYEKVRKVFFTKTVTVQKVNSRESLFRTFSHFQHFPDLSKTPERAKIQPTLRVANRLIPGGAALSASAGEITPQPFPRIRLCASETGPRDL